MTVETLLADLVRVDSVNPDLVPGGAGEGAIACAIVEWAATVDLEAHVVEPVPGRPSVVVVARGQEMSSYPAHCIVGIERRTVPGETIARVEGELQAILDQAVAATGTAPAFRAEHRTTLVRDPFEVPEDAPIVELVRRHAAHATGTARRVFGDTPWMDAAFIAAAGIPTVVFGPGGAGAHAVEEWADLASVRGCADVLLAVAREFCA